MMPEVGQGMLLDAVDANDVAIGVVQRSQVFKLQANFRVAHILVFDSKRNLLLQQLSHTRLRHPGFWGSSVAAYVFAGESYEAAALRRLSEELGVLGQNLKEVGKISMIDEGCHKFIGVFTTTQNGPFHYDKTQIESLESMPIQAIRRLIVEETRPFTPTFLRVLDFYESVSRI